MDIPFEGVLVALFVAEFLIGFYVGWDSHRDRVARRRGAVDE